MQAFPDEESSFFIAGPVGRLQLKTSVPAKAEAKPGAVTIVCHPHSLMGGTMNNKVVHTVGRARRDCGHRVVRFNFRGVEQSEGAYADGIGEQEDLRAVINWVQTVRPQDLIYIAGFSFGAYVSAALCNRLSPQGLAQHLLLIAPAVVNYDFAGLHRFDCPLTLLYGDQDEVVDSEAIKQWFDQIASAKRAYCIEGAGHFFHGRLTEVKSILEQDLRSD